MCGLYSALSYGQGQPLSIEDLKAPIAALYHRGPDGYGYDISADGLCGLAHARLSIIDLDGGAQPLRHKNADISLIVNGEFYDFERVRRELESQGHVFQTGSDSEIALHLYRQYDLDFVHHLRGEFAFVLYDGEKGRLIAGRDRFGIKPLVYCVDETRQRLMIASEAKAILAAGYPAIWDQQAYAHASQIQYLPPNKTLFKGIYQLEPGMLLIHERGKDMRLKRYWDMDYPTQASLAQSAISEATACQDVHDQMREAVRLRLRADVPVCCHLSGGIDSGAIAGLAADISAQPITCFTVSFPNQDGYDEKSIAQEQADYIGADLHVVDVRPDDMIDTIDDAVFKSEGLSINGHLAGKYLLSQAIAKAGYKVTLSGEGSDEIFAGYPHFREDILLHSGESGAIKDQLKSLYKSNNKLAGLFLADGAQLDTSAIENALGYVPSFIKAKASLGFRIQDLLCDDYRAEALKTDAFREVIDHIDVDGQLAGRNSVDQSSYLWTKLTLAGYILKTLGDGCEMAHSLEGRVPFLDHSLFEYVRQLSLDLKIRFVEGRGLQEKYILREAMRPYITDTLYKRQKHPFIAPPVSGVSGVYEKMGDMLNSAAMRDQPFYDRAKVKNWFDALRGADAATHITHESVMMMVLTTLAAQDQFKLGAGS